MAFALASAAHATTLRVPSDQPDVRAAIAAAASGDTILIAPGTYAGGAFVNGKALTIASRYLVTGDTSLVAQTVLSGDAAGACGGVPGCSGNSVLEFGAAASGSAVIGLTLTKGENGVGSASRVDVIHCRVIANGDGADYTSGAGGTLRSSVFRNNTDDGIDLNGYLNLTIVDNDIRNNGDDGIEYRLYAYAGPSLEVDILNNQISGNHEDGVQLIDYPGAGNYAIRIERNLFQANYDATGLSAGVAFMPNGETIESLAGAPSTRRTYVSNNTFVGEKNGLVGGANVIALNNIFTDVAGVALLRVGGNSISSYSLFWACGTNFGQSVVDAPHLVFGNPLLNSSARLTPASPAINAGIAFFQWHGETVLNLPPTSYADAAPDLGAYESPPNMAPVVSAGPDRTVTLSPDVQNADVADPPLMWAQVPLTGSVSDDGLPYPFALSMLWTTVSGPGPVQIQSPNRPYALASFNVPGTYVLQLTASDGLLTSSDVMQVTVLDPPNRKPFVDAGNDQTVTLPASAQLAGVVIDDGLPIPPGAVSALWTKVSGPGLVKFFGPTLASSSAGFFTPGTYVLRLTASDGAASASDTVTITVLPVPNAPPAVSAGPDLTFMYPLGVTLGGTVSDDGLPNPPAAVTTLWTVVSAPGLVTFQDASAVVTPASFGAPGVYALRLQASDGALSASDTVQVVVQPPPPAFETRIALDSDDAQEDDHGRLVHDGGSIDLVAGNQIAGLRFTNVTVPHGAIVLGATIQFRADAASSDPAQLTVQGQANDNPTTFASLRYNISLRPRTAASVSWTPPPWALVGEAGLAQRTADLTNVIQEIIDLPGWASGNALAIIITGTGHRVATSHEAGGSGAALLHIEYGGILPAAAPHQAASPAPAHQAASPVAVGLADGPRQSLAARFEFALRGASTQPSHGSLVVEFTLADNGPAVLELHDLTGRRFATREVGSMGPGAHAVEFSERLPAGIYLVRLTQGDRSLLRKAIILR